MISNTQLHSNITSAALYGGSRGAVPAEKQSSELQSKQSNRSLETEKQPENRTSKANSKELNQQEQRQISQLQQRDQEVRAHEAAHLSAAGTLAISGANYSYQNGPDNRRYAVSGEVSINTAPVANDPKATLDKSVQIQRAALAPTQPSAQDTSVAAQAAQMGAKARMEIISLRINPEATTAGDKAIELYQKSEALPAKNSFSAYA